MAHDTERVKRAHPIAEVIAAHGVKLRPGGGRLSGRCPFHEDRSPSLVVYPETRSFYCFGCGAGGDVIDFIRRTDGIGFREALARLGEGQPTEPLHRPPSRIFGSAAEALARRPAHAHGRLRALPSGTAALSRGAELPRVAWHPCLDRGALPARLRRRRAARPLPQAPAPQSQACAGARPALPRRRRSDGRSHRDPGSARRWCAAGGVCS